MDLLELERAERRGDVLDPLPGRGEGSPEP
jgi:hypothetical protein